MDGEIDSDELEALLEADQDLRIVDIRSKREFDRGHIPGSENIPFPELTTRVAELDGAGRIVTVCPHGISSRQAAQLIGSYAGTVDARVESLAGGTEGWNGPFEQTESTTDRPDEGPEAPF